MGLITKTVIMNINNNAKWYEEKGYKIIKKKNNKGQITIPRGTKIIVKVEDLPNNSMIKVDVQCDNLNCTTPIIKPVTWSNYKKYVREDGKYYCQNCSSKLFGAEKTAKTKLENGTIFYDWCYENLSKEQADEIIARWDYDLNKCSPKDVLYSTHKKFYFKCPSGFHPSELKNINSFTNNFKKYKSFNSLNCKMCNSLGQWCLNNKRQDVLDRWDYELNNCSPFDIGHNSLGFNKKGYWFKCPRKIHSSELKNIHHFTNGNLNSLDCNKCNSFAQYGYDNIDSQFLEKYWNYKKNIDEDGNPINPWLIPKSSCKIKVWIFCQEKFYHGSYNITCNEFYMGNRCSYCGNFKVHIFDSLGWLYPEVWAIWSKKNKKSPYEYKPFSTKEVYWKCLDKKHKDYCRIISNSNIYNFRCPECVKKMDESIIEEKTRLYLESLNYKVWHENKCTLVPINPKTRYPLPFDNEILINGIHLLCEVMGEQHYKESSGKWFNKNFNLHRQKLYDRYKRFISYINDYEYLEIPYTAFDKNDTYKKLINEKINKILN